jgi:hypothetical protein
MARFSFYIGHLFNSEHVPRKGMLDGKKYLYKVYLRDLEVCDDGILI